LRPPESDGLEGGILPSLDALLPMGRYLDETSKSKFSAFETYWLEFSLSSLYTNDGFRTNLKLPEDGSRLLFGCDLLKLEPWVIPGRDC
jgi:hypothetical protein